MLLLASLLLQACTHSGVLPSSERLEEIRDRREAGLIEKLALHQFPYGAPLYIRIFKEEAALETWLKDPATGRYRLFKTYQICDFSGTLGPKLREGDFQAPEGFYTIQADQMNPWSQYHLSVNLGFPNAFERAQGLTGSNLMIHGDCKSEGCYAMGDRAIEEIYLMIEASLKTGPQGVPVHIFPFRMSQKNMQKHRTALWYPFWRNLQQGYEIFNRSYQVPKVEVSTGQDGTKYVFEEASISSAISSLFQ